MQLNLDSMSTAELQFIRLYCTRLRDQYDSVRTVMALMSQNDFGLKCPVTATKIADALAGLGRNFDYKLAEVCAKHSLKEKKIPRDEAQFLNELADVFALSFFKVVAYENLEEAPPQIVKDGWCSGEPSSWAQQLDDTGNSPESNIISAIVNFFAHLMPWGYPPHQYKNMKTYEERDEEYEDDEWYEDD